MRDLIRTVQVLAVAVQQLVAHALWRLAGREPISGPRRLRRLLERIGGTYLKFGQVLSLQPDILPREYCSALFDLLDRVPPYPYADVERTFVEDLGSPPGQLFDSFSERPIASASIAQVHVAELAGERYAIKVRRPTVHLQFAADLRFMMAVARTIELSRLRRAAWLARAVREFAAWTHEELDFRYEARFMAALAHNAEDNPHEKIPVVHTGLSTPRILVAELLDGPMVLDYIRSLDAGDTGLGRSLRETGFDPDVFASHIVENFVWDAFQHGLFHADLHPANLIILPDNVVGYVDFGITGALSRYSRRNIVAMTLALTRAEPEELTDHFFRIATAEQGADRDAFRRELRRCMESWFEWDGDVPNLTTSYTRVMIDFLKMCRSTGIWAMPDALRYLRSVITADGLISRFASEVDISVDLERLCERYLEREMWRRWLSPESLADWTAAAARLTTAAPTLASMLLQRGADTDIPTPGGQLAGSRPRDAGRRALQYALLTAASTALLLAAGSSFAVGVNLVTAAGAVCAGGATMFLVNLLRFLCRRRDS